MSGFAVKPLDIPRLYEEIARVLDGRPETLDGAPVPGRARVHAIDWERGVALWGDRARLADRILTFLEEAPTKYPLPDPDADVDAAALLFSLHGLRGAAGNLALVAVSQLAGELEDQGRAKGLADVLLQLPQLRSLMDAVWREAKVAHRAAFEVVEPGRAAQPDAVDPGVAVSDADLATALAALRDVLARNELDDGALEQVCAGLQARGERARVQALRMAIDAFEFERAGVLLAEAQSADFRPVSDGADRG